MMRDRTNGVRRRRVTILMPEELWHWLKSQERSKGFRSFSNFLSVVLSSLKPHIKGLKIVTDIPLEEDLLVTMDTEGESDE